MNTNQYLIPANTKRGQLIFGYFTWTDLWIAIIGVSTTLIILLILSTTNLTTDGYISIFSLIPGLLAIALVFPFPNYHNVRTVLGEIIAFYSNRQKYVWRGWCSSYEFKDK